MSEPSKTSWDPNEGLTLFGRKPALEALLDPSLTIHCLHLADSNRPAGIIAQITAEAERRGAEIRYHDRLALSRISKNGRQDQGVALDVVCPQFMSLSTFLNRSSAPQRVLALDGVTNPQNVGMIIRSAVAADNRRFEEIPGGCLDDQGSHGGDASLGIQDAIDSRRNC